MIASIAGAVVTAGLWASSPNLREFVALSIHQAQAYGATNADNSVGDHIEFLRKSLTFVREAPLVGHGTGSIADLFRRSAIGQTGAAGVATVNPHSQIFGVAMFSRGSSTPGHVDRSLLPVSRRGLDRLGRYCCCR